MNFNNKNVQS